MLINIDLYAENPIIGKTIKQCIVEETYHDETNTYQEINNVSGDELIINGNSGITLNSTSGIENNCGIYVINASNYSFNDTGYGANYTVLVNNNLSLGSNDMTELYGEITTITEHVVLGAPDLGWSTPSPSVNGLVSIKPTNRTNSAYLEFLNATTDTVTLDFNSDLDNCSVELLYGGNLFLQNLSKVKITGGTNGQVIRTDGAGNLSWVTPSAGLTDGDKGDITVSGSGSTWTIDNQAVTNSKIQDNAVGNSKIAPLAVTTDKIGDNAVTFAKMQSINNGRLLGRSSFTAGVPTEITVGSGLTLSSGTLSAIGVSDGDRGDITVSSSGGLWSIDPNAVTYSKIQNVTANRLLGRESTSSGIPQEITLGTGLSLSGTTLNVSSSGGAQVQIYEYRLSGEFTAPAWAKKLEIYMLPAGGGGGSGRRGAVATDNYGGCGGGYGIWSKIEILTSTTNFLSVTIGAGGLGGASQSSNNTEGNNGQNGGATSVSGTGVYFEALGANGGRRGDIDPFTAGFAPVGTTSSTGYGYAFDQFSPFYRNYLVDGQYKGTGNKGNGFNFDTQSGSIGKYHGCCAGGGGAGRPADIPLDYHGGSTWIWCTSPSPYFRRTVVQYGNGQNGSEGYVGFLPISCGGGGGGSDIARVGGNGGNGGIGSGGGGGGASDNGFNSGAGGNGGSGCVVIVAIG